MAAIFRSASIFPVRDFSRVDDAPLFADRGGPRRPVPESRWPLYVLWVLSLVAFSVALFNRVAVSAIACTVLTVAAFVLLLLYRMAVVRATRTVAGSGTVLGIRRIERITVLAVALGSIANGVVLGLWFGALEVWFR